MKKKKTHLHWQTETMSAALDGKKRQRGREGSGTHILSKCVPEAFDLEAILEDGRREVSEETEDDDACEEDLQRDSKDR